MDDHRLPRTALFLATALIALFAIAASASAATYYVSSTGSGTDCTLVAPCATIADALDAHRVAPTLTDVIDVGPGVFEGFDASDPADDGLTIRGALTGATRDTTIRPAPGSFGILGNTVTLGVCPSAGEGVTLRDANVDTQGADDSVGALEFDGDSTLLNVHAANQPGSTAGSVVDACEGHATITDSTIVAGDDDFGIMLIDGLTLTDSTVESTGDAPAIIQFLSDPAGGPITVTRSTVTTASTTQPALQSASDLTLDSSLVTGGAQGVAIVGGGTAEIGNSTIDAGAPGFGAGTPSLLLDNAGETADVTVNSTILVDPLRADSGAGTAICDYSDLPQPGPPPGGWTFDCDTGAGTTNTSTDPSLLFVGGSPFSWLLKSGSPAIDAGDPAPLGPGESTTDLLGNPRVRHGTAASCPDGVRDMGAYEAADVACVPAVIDPPRIERATAPVVGTELGLYAGTWTNTPTSYAFQWIRCDYDGSSNCTDIAGSTASTYTPVLADAGRTLRVRVIASNGDGPSLPATSVPSGMVTGPVPVPVVTDPPRIERATSPVVGTKLGLYAGAWSNSPVAYQFQWVRCDYDGVSNCTDIAGSTASTYTPVLADAGYTLRVRVVAINGGGPSAPATSVPSGMVTGPIAVPVMTDPPRIERATNPVVGVKLGLYRGLWSNSPVAYQYQWIRCDADGVSNCTDIAGRTASTYTPTAADLAHRLRVRVVAINGGGPSAPATSVPSGVVT